MPVARAKKRSAPSGPTAAAAPRKLGRSAARSAGQRESGASGATNGDADPSIPCSKAPPRRCDICGCPVPGDARSWDVHVAGIRHRRNAASCRLFGDPGHAVVSIFEPVDLAARAGHQDARDAQRCRGLPRRVPCCFGEDALQARLQRLQQRLSRLLADAVGAAGALHACALERFSLPQLRAAWRGTARALQQPTQAAALQLDLAPADAAEVACLGELLPAQTLALRVRLPYHTYGPAAAAMSAAVADFARCLTRAHRLARLELAFHSDEYGSILRQGGAGVIRLPLLWGRAAAALSACLAVNSGLRLLLLRAYPGMLAADDVARISSSRAAATPARRLALLAGTHPRLGAASPLRVLPREVLARLLDEAVPLAPLELRWQLPQGIIAASGDAGGSSGSSSSSSSNNDSSSDDGGDSSSSSSSSEDGAGVLPADVAAAAAAASGR